MLDPLDSSVPGWPEQLSALVDGELPAEEVEGAVAHWRTQASARADWHAFQLIGDVLRSDDLASTGPHDVQFLAALRERLAREPVVLAPTDAPKGHATRLPARRPWLWSSAAAFGLVALGGTLWVGPATRPGAAPDTLATQSPPVYQAASVPVDATPAVPPVVVRGPQGDLLRDAEIDRYLAAHQQFVGTSALGAPSGFIRNAAVDAPHR